MSAATLDEYTSVNAESSSVKSHSISSKAHDSKHGVLAERARILETVARKAQEKTLTLEETTDLYARFNRTYESGYQSRKLPQEDESWALKLLEECSQETDPESALQTRVNGIPQASQSLQLIQSARTKPAPQTKSASNINADQSSIASTRPSLSETILQDNPLAEIIAEEMAADKPKLNLREAFIYDQFNFAHDAKAERARKNANQTFWIILGISSILTVTALMMLSQIM